MWFTPVYRRMILQDGEGSCLIHIHLAVFTKALSQRREGESGLAWLSFRSGFRNSWLCQMAQDCKKPFGWVGSFTRCQGKQVHRGWCKGKVCHQQLAGPGREKAEYSCPVMLLSLVGSSCFSHVPAVFSKLVCLPAWPSPSLTGLVLTIVSSLFFYRTFNE